MTAKELMTANPACCTKDASLQEVAGMMVQYDCGEIPVVERQGGKRVVGVVTDRDIVCRAVAQGKDCASITASSVMSSPAVTVQERDSLDEVVRVMETNRIRRVPVVNQSGDCCGIIAQADVARAGSRTETGELVREVSVPR
jgi:CBS domain-containing protein